MKKKRGLLVTALILVTVIILNNSKCFAAETTVTWNPNNKGANVDLYDNNLTIGGAGGYNQNATTTDGGYSSGKYYWEVTSTSIDSNTASNDCMIGVKDVLKKTLDDMDAKIGYFSQYDNILNNHSIDKDSTIGILMDLDNHVLKIMTKNGLNQKVVQLQSGVTYRPAICGVGSVIKVTANFGATAFKYTLPEGYVPYQGTGVTSILKVVLEPDEQLQLSVTDDLTDNTKLYWSSSDSNVATVDKDGVVTAINPGNTVITVKNKRGTYTDKINIFVVDDASDYRLAVDLKIGQSCRLTVDDYTNTKKVTWTSMDSTIATVNSNGKVKAVGEGLVLVTVTDEQGKEIGQIYVRVRK